MPPPTTPAITRPPDAPMSTAAKTRRAHDDVSAGTPRPRRRRPGCSKPVVWLNSSEVMAATAVGDVVGQHLALEQRALGVERAELVLRHAVDGRPLGAPSAGEDAAALHDPVGIDAVDPDAVLAELGGEQPDLVGLIGLDGAVGDVVRSGEHGVLRADVDDVATEALVDHRPRRRLGDEEAALGHHVVLQVPVGLGRVQQRLGDRQAGVVDDEIEPAEGEQRGIDGGTDLLRVADVSPGCRRRRRRCRSPPPRPRPWRGRGRR